jgi:hypothetical protein
MMTDAGVWRGGVNRQMLIKAARFIVGHSAMFKPT